METTGTGEIDPRVQRSRDRVLVAATELLINDGPRACTVDAVAERSGVAKSTIYRHWSSRAELVVDVAHSMLPPVEAPEAASFEEAIRAKLHELADIFASEQRGRVLGTIMTMRYTVPDLADLLDQDHQQHLALVEQVLEQGRAEGRDFSGLEAETAMYLWLGPVLLASMQDYEGSLHELVDRSIDQFLAAYPAG